jgi:hypothetical protein
MDESFNARMGSDPERIGPSFHEPAGEDPEVAAAQAADGGVEPEDPTTTTPAALRSPSPSELGEDFDDACGDEHAEDGIEDEDEEGDPAACLNDWLRDNWQTIHDLARAGQLPELNPPVPGQAQDERSEAEALSDEEEDAEDNDDCNPFAFDPVPLRERIDGWTAERQVAFIECLAESACVVEACKSVEMTKQSAYALRARPEAISFRTAWDAALDYATRCLGDAALARAVKGVANPVFYQGQQIGERRTYDERLTMFLLQRRDPLQYGAWRDKAEWDGHPEAQAFELLKAKAAIREDADLGSDSLPARFVERLRAITASMRGRKRLRELREG